MSFYNLIAGSDWFQFGITVCCIVLVVYFCLELNSYILSRGRICKRCSGSGKIHYKRIETVEKLRHSDNVITKITHDPMESPTVCCNCNGVGMTYGD